MLTQLSGSCYCEKTFAWGGGADTKHPTIPIPPPHLQFQWGSFGKVDTFRIVNLSLNKMALPGILTNIPLFYVLHVKWCRLTLKVQVKMDCPYAKTF